MFTVLAEAATVTAQKGTTIGTAASQQAEKAPAPSAARIGQVRAVGRFLRVDLVCNGIQPRGDLRFSELTL